MLEYIDPLELHAHYDVTTDEEVRHNFTEEELASLKDRHFELTLHQMKRTELLKAISELISADIEGDKIMESVQSLTFDQLGTQGLKTLKANIRQSILFINKGYEIVKMKLYGVADHDNNVMVFYKPDGHYQYHRPLRHDERQGNILNLSIKSA